MVKLTSTVQSSEPLATSCGPRRAGWQLFTISLWDLNFLTHVPVSISQTRTVLSVDAVNR